MVDLDLIPGSSAVQSCSQLPCRRAQGPTSGWHPQGQLLLLCTLFNLGVFHMFDMHHNFVA